MSKRAMGRRQRDLLLLLGLVVAVLLSYLLLAHVREQSRVEPYAEGRIDYQVEDFELTELDENGRLVLRLRGEYWEHDRWEQRANFRDVTMLGYDQGEWLWQADANEGHINDAGTEVELLGDVKLRYREQDEESVMNTTALTLYPDQRRFHTDQAVEVLRGDSRVLGSAMRGDLLTGEVIIDDMQSRVLPAERPQGGR